MSYFERVVGKDSKGHPRVYAPTTGEAHIEAMDYVKRRPDTGPLDKWTFVLEYHNDEGCYKRHAIN